MIWFCIIMVVFMGLGSSRKVRRLAFDLSRIMGDAVALRNGTIVKRFFRKRAQRLAGSTINRWKR